MRSWELFKQYAWIHFNVTPRLWSYKPPLIVIKVHALVLWAQTLMLTTGVASVLLMPKNGLTILALMLAGCFVFELSLTSLVRLWFLDEGWHIGD